MKKLPLYIFFLIFVLSGHLLATTWTTDVTQDGAGGACEDGGECSAAEFNALSGDYSDSVFYFSGTVVTRITVKIYGTSGHYLTLDGYEGGDCDPVNAECTSAANLTDGLQVGDGASIGPDYINVQDFRMTRNDGNTPCLQFYPDTDGSDDAAHIDYINIRRNYVYQTDGTMFHFNQGRHVSIQNNKFVHFGQNGTDAVQGVNLIGLENWILEKNEIGHDEDSYPSGCTSAELIEIHYCTNGLIQYNDLYGAPNQAGICPKEYGHLHDLIIRFNKIHDNNAQGILTHTATGIASNSIYNLFVYGNAIYNNGQSGISIGQNNYDIYIWSNVIRDNGRHGVVHWTPSENSHNIYIHNNTFARNGDDNESDAARGGIVLIACDETLAYENNIFWNNRPGGAGSLYHQIYATDAISVLEHNTYYHTSATATVYYDGGYRSLATLQGTYNFEDDSPAGDVADPGFTDPDGSDTTYGTADDDYTLNGNNIDDGADIGDADDYSVTVQGTTYYVGFALALDPSVTDWTSFPSESTVAVVNQQSYGAAWERGAYAYTAGGASSQTGEVVIDLSGTGKLNYNSGGSGIIER